MLALLLFVIGVSLGILLGYAFASLQARRGGADRATPEQARYARESAPRPVSPHYGRPFVNGPAPKRLTTPRVGRPE